jgi:integrase
MTPRRRIHKGLEPNVYLSVTKGTNYYRYRHPITGKFHGIGSNKALANKRARLLNTRLIPEEETVIDHILGISGVGVPHLVARFREERVPEMKLKLSTERSLMYRLARIEKDMSNKVVDTINTEDCATWLDDNFVKDPYVKHRNTLIALFRFAINKGYRADNPAESTYASRQDTGKDRTRLTLAQFKDIEAIAPPWMQLAMRLSLITLLGRAEVVNLRYVDIRDDCLYVIRQKIDKHDHARLRIAITPDIAEILQESRRSGIASPYVIHRRPTRIKPNKETDHWSQIHPNVFSTVFRKLREQAPSIACLPKEQRPTFHEVRALGSWLYEKAGYDRDYVQRLMAHSDGAMTEYYQTEHEEKWVDVQADLALKNLLNP